MVINRLLISSEPVATDESTNQYKYGVAISQLLHPPFEIYLPSTVK